MVFKKKIKQPAPVENPGMMEEHVLPAASEILGDLGLQGLPGLPAQQAPEPQQPARRRIEVVKEIPTQEIRQYQDEHGIIVEFKTIEEALSELMNLN